MTTLYIRAEDVRFPQRCLSCDAPAEATHDLSACRSYDFLVVAAWEFFDLPVPLCRACKRRRRLAGIALWTLFPLLILVGGFVCLELLLEEWKVSAGVLGALLLASMLVVRFRGDHLLEWHTIGVRATLLRGEGNQLQLSFRRQDVAEHWQRLNPRAVATRAALADFIPTPMSTTLAEPSVAFTRKIPAITLAVMLGLLYLHDWNAVANREIYPAAVLFLTLASGLALGGTIHPPLFWAVGKYGAHLPAWKKAVAVMFVAAGFAAGMLLLFSRY